MKYSLFLLVATLLSSNLKAQESEIIDLKEIKNTPELYFNTGINVDTLKYCRPDKNGFYGHYYIRHRRFRYTLGKMDVFVQGIPQDWKFTDHHKETFLFIELNEPGLPLFDKFDIGSKRNKVIEILNEENESIEVEPYEIRINNPDYEITLSFEEDELTKITIKSECK